MSKSCAGESKHFFFRSRMFNPCRLQSLFVEIFMVNFGIFFTSLKREEKFLNKDTSFLEITSIEVIIQYRPSCSSFSTSSNIHSWWSCFEATTSQEISQQCTVFMMKLLKSMEIIMYGITLLKLLIIYLWLLLLKGKFIVCMEDSRPKERLSIPSGLLRGMQKYLHRDRFAILCGLIPTMIFRIGSPTQEWQAGFSVARQCNSSSNRMI